MSYHIEEKEYDLNLNVNLHVAGENSAELEGNLLWMKVRR